MENEPDIKPDLEKSPLREAYLLLEAKTPLELSNKFCEEDQKAIKDRSWDYKDEDLLINRVKNILENATISELSSEEQYWHQEILWFWYHHAISCAIWKYRDRDMAKKYAARALELQADDHPNKITRLFDLLVNDKLGEAAEWAKTIEEEPEKGTARDLIKEYLDGRFF